jgi:hypothetical protein
MKIMYHNFCCCYIYNRKYRHKITCLNSHEDPDEKKKGKKEEVAFNPLSPKSHASIFPTPHVPRNDIIILHYGKTHIKEEKKSSPLYNYVIILFTSSRDKGRLKYHLPGTKG